MATEIERKFLVDKKKWEAVEKPRGVHFHQAYITTDPRKVVRVRITDNKSFLTIKGQTTGITRNEFEYEIPRKDAEAIISQFACCAIEKIRYTIQVKKNVWEIDEFLDENAGLIVAEIELKNEQEVFQIPEWVSMEVTSEEKYYNFKLAQEPYSRWKPTAEQTKVSTVPSTIIKAIAESVDAGLCCFLHRKTFELVSIPDPGRFPEMDWEDEDSDWAADIKRVTSDISFLEIDVLDSHESYEIMEDFVFSLSESKTKNLLESAINGKKPFANFNRLIHQAGKERDEWFAFKLDWMKSWVINQLEWKLHEPDNDDE